jgi:hypothetical protein
MITRSFQKGDAASVAVYSDCERYRYSLTRVWNDAGSRALFIMLNPSTATEVQNDPTVERCERRARALGFGAFRVLNIFAWRATDPRDMRAAADPVGPENDSAILDSLPWADSVVCAWGTHGAHLGRGLQVEAASARNRRPVDASGPVQRRGTQSIPSTSATRCSPWNGLRAIDPVRVARQRTPWADGVIAWQLQASRREWWQPMARVCPSTAPGLATR